MTITIRGTTPATDIAIGVDATLSVTLTGARQPQAGDLLVILHTNNFYALSNMPTPTVAGSTAGVTSIANADGGSNFPHTKAWYYVVGSTGDLTVAVTETGTADEEKGFAVYVLSGVDTASPLDGTPSTGFSTTNSSSRVLGSITTANPDSFLIAVIGPGPSAGGTGHTPPSAPWVEDVDVDITGGSAFYYTTGHEQLSASGTTGSRTFTLVASATEWSGVMAAIKAGGAAPAAPAIQTQQWPATGGWPWQQQQYPLQPAPTAATNAPADVATATGAAFFDAAGGSISLNLIADSPVLAVGTAYNATVSTATGTNAAAHLASATGTANNASAAVAPTPGLASGTATANGTTGKVSPGPTAAAGTGVAQAPSPAVATGPTTASGTGAANNATISTGSFTNAAATTATGGGAANQPTQTVATGATAATATGTAQTASSSVAPSPSTATGTGAAHTATGKVSPSPTAASGTGTAHNAVVQTGSFTNALAGVATATGVAQQTSGKTSTTPTVATATGTATAASAGSSVSAQAGLASGTGTASNPTVTRGATANAGVATGTGTVSAAQLGVMAAAEAAVALGTAMNAAVNPIAAITPRPNAGRTIRPNTGITQRP